MYSYEHCYWIAFFLWKKQRVRLTYILFSKVFEKVVYNHVIDFIDTNSLLSKQQFGFRKNHSTNHAVIALIDKILKNMENSQATYCSVVGCYINLKKAFDTVNHRILINKLQLYGIRGHILDWFRSYLQNRKQYIHINDKNSNLGSISCGVPQESILGPLLFILYINDISNISHLMHIILFADDTTILFESDHVSTALKLKPLGNENNTPRFYLLNRSSMLYNL